MNSILGRFQVENVEAWKQVIERDKAAHKEAGLRFSQVWKNIDNPKEIFFIFEAEDLEKARLFLKKAGALDREKRAKGEIPELTFLESA